MHVLGGAVVPCELRHCLLVDLRLHRFLDHWDELLAKRVRVWSENLEKEEEYLGNLNATEVEGRECCGPPLDNVTFYNNAKS